LSPSFSTRAFCFLVCLAMLSALHNLKTKIKEIEAQIKRHLARIEELGGVIKGIEPLLVDFLSEYNGRYIWLCWKEDEETIMYWHELSEGFAGRKPVKELEKSEQLF
ncbi:MAG TPA: DUF2203 family protein, partial [Aquificaceae bacterium]|nr:DUF2203 family protein [Aquificaceae bacterium]